jgi:hypothetical protein
MAFKSPGVNHLRVSRQKLAREGFWRVFVGREATEADANALAARIQRILLRKKTPLLDD